MSSVTPTSNLTIASILQSSSTSTSSSSSSTTSGIAGLLQTASSGGSSIFGAINGTSSTTASTGIFNILSPGSSTTSIQSLLQQQKYTTQKTALYTNIAQRLTVIQNGSYTPKSDWEKVAGYAMQTGQPLAISLDSKGAIQATPQSQADLSQFNIQQQSQLTSAMNSIAAMANKIQANKTNQGLIDKLNGAENDLSAVATGSVAPQKSSPNNWEADGVELMRTHHPFTISLDAKGNLQVQDQLTAPMTNVPLNQQQTLRSALESLPNVLATGKLTQIWQAQAQSYDQNAIPYHLSIDSITNQISAVENSGANIMPSFLKKQPYSDIGANTPLLKQAATFIQKSEPYLLNFDTTGHVVAQAATAHNLLKYNTPTQTAQGTQYGVGSLLSTVA
jgi:hypothetical protein